MSQENVEEVVRNLYAAWNAQDEERFPELVAEDFEYSTSGQFPGFDPVYRGLEGALRFRDEMLSAWEYFRIDIRDLEIRENKFVTTVRFEGKGRSSGVDAGLDFFHSGRVEHGKVTFVAARRSREEALEAVGFPE